MSFRKVTLSLLMMCAVAPISTSDTQIARLSESGRDVASSEVDREIVRRSLQKKHRKHRAPIAAIDRSEVNENRRGGCCCSCLKKTVITVAALSLALAGWNEYEKGVLRVDAQGLPNEMNSCTNMCNPQDMPCYDRCATQAFSPSNPELRSVTGNGYAALYRDKARKHYYRCKNFWIKGDDASFSSKECSEAVVKDIAKDEKRDASIYARFDTPNGIKERPLTGFEFVGAVFGVIAGL